MHSPLLLVDQDPASQQIVGKALATLPGSPTLTVLPHAAACKDHLKYNGRQLVLLNLDLPDAWPCFQLLQSIPGKEVIPLVSSIGTLIAIRFVGMDYLLKPLHTSLVQTLLERKMPPQNHCRTARLMS